MFCPLGTMFLWVSFVWLWLVVTLWGPGFKISGSDLTFLLSVDDWFRLLTCGSAHCLKSLPIIGDHSFPCLASHPLKTFPPLFFITLGRLCWVFGGEERGRLPDSKNSSSPPLHQTQGFPLNLLTPSSLLSHILYFLNPWLFSQSKDGQGIPLSGAGLISS